MAGIGSNAGTLPLGDANAIMMDMGEREILPVVRDVPGIGGVIGTDPTRNMRRFLEQVLDVGFAGVINFPTMGIIDGRWRQSLEETGFSYALEVDMIAAARALGLYTMAYTFTDDEARQMASVGVDVVVAHLGTTVGGLIGADPANTPSLDDAVRRTQQMVDAARAEHPDIIVLTHGGPIATPPRRPDRAPRRGPGSARAHDRAGVRRGVDHGAAPRRAGHRRHRAGVQGR